MVRDILNTLEQKITTGLDTPKIKRGTVKPIKFKCQFCRRTFKTVQALGGHTSHSHKGMSQKYALK